VVISIFIVLMIGLGNRLIAACMPEPAVASYYKTAAAYFLWVYFGMTVYLLMHGYWVGMLVRAKLRKAGPFGGSLVALERATVWVE
jgi:hypothetical protein